MAASVAVHEKRNLLAPINRLPLDVLLLIPLHFTSLSDRLRLTFVCRRWRRAFIQHPPLWSQLYLAGRTDRYLIITLLRRVRGTPLDITIDNSVSPVHDTTLLSSFNLQIRTLRFGGAFPHEVQEVSVAISDPLPLLHTLAIEAIHSPDRGTDSAPDATLPLFTNAVNLKYFSLTTDEFPSLYHFTFPNLTSFSLSTWPDTFAVSHLLDFLETSPALQHIYIMIEPISNFDEDVSPERVVVLPHVKFIHLRIIQNDPDCKIATHISCPSAERTKFDYFMQSAGLLVPEDIYTISHPLDTIVHQYTNTTVERVVFELEMLGPSTLDCSLTFSSSNGTTLELSYVYFSPEDDTAAVLDERLPPIFSQSCRKIRDHPKLASVGYLRIDGGGLLTNNPKLATSDVGGLLGSMGPLKRLTLDSCDLRPFLDPFLETPLFPDEIQPTSFPPIKKLTIRNPAQSLHDGEYATVIVRLARSQRARGAPFECMVFDHEAPSTIIERLSSLVAPSTGECED